MWSPSRRSAALAVVLAAASAFALERPSYLGPKPARPPARVVTLAPSLTDAVLALGGKALLVGVSRFDEAKEVAQLPRVGGFVDPSVEAVVGLRPDLVLVQPAPGNRAPVEKLAELGVSVLALPMHTVPEVLAALREMGAALGRPEQARAVVEQIERTRAEVRARARRRPPRRVLFVYGFEPLVVAGPGSFADELLSDLGAKNAAASARSPYPVYSAESAVRDRPEVVVDLSMTERGQEQLRSLPGLEEARWVRPSSKDLMHPGPGLARGLLELEALLGP